MLNSIRKRLLITILFIIIVVGVITLIKSFQDARYEVQELFDAQLAQSARSIQAQVLYELSNIDPATFQKILDNQASIPQPHNAGDDHNNGHEATPYGHEYERKIAFQIWDQDKKHIIHSVAAPAAPLSKFSLDNKQPGYSDERLNEQSWRVFTLLDNNRQYIIQVGEQYEVRDELTNKISRRLIMPSMISLPILALMIWIGIGRGLAPLLKVTREVSLRAPEYLESIDTGPIPTEIQPLAQALNKLLLRLKEALLKERRFTDDAAHELRTPLAALKTQAQVAIRSTNAKEQNKALCQILLGVDRATHLVEQMLTLARYSPENNKLTLTRIPLYKLTAEVLALHTPNALKKNIELILSGNEQVHVKGEQTVLSILFGNLIDNAIKYSSENSHINVTIVKEKSGIFWTITDEGPGIDPELQERVFDRFYRIIGNESSGSGLGLAIVKQCSDLLKASINIRNSSSQGGMIAEVLFPESIAE